MQFSRGQENPWRSLYIHFTLTPSILQAMCNAKQSSLHEWFGIERRAFYAFLKSIINDIAYIYRREIHLYIIILYMSVL